MIFRIISTAYFIMHSSLLMAQPGIFERLLNDKVNDAGTAITFNRSFQNKVFLELKNLKFNVAYSFENLHSNDVVLNDDYFIGIDYVKNLLYTVDLKLPKVDTILDVNRFHWIPKQQLVIYNNKSKLELNIWEIKSNKLLSIPNVKYLDISDQQRKLIYINTSDELIYFDLKTKNKKVYKIDHIDAIGAKRVLWNKENDTAYLISNSKTDFRILQVNAKANTSVFQQPLINEEKKSIVDTMFKNACLLSNQQIALGVKSYKNSSVELHKVEPWLSSTKGITPVVDKGIETSIQLGIADLRNNAWINLFNPLKWMEYKINSNDGIIYSYEVNENDDLTKYYPERSVYSLSKDFQEKRFIGKFNGSGGQLSNTPNFSGLVYFMDNDWFYYDHKFAKHVNITEKVSENFYDSTNETYLISRDQALSGINFSRSGQFILAGENDIWFFNPNHNRLERKTNGAKEKKKYNLSLCNYYHAITSWGWNSRNYFQEYEDLVLTWKSPTATLQGLSLLGENGKTIPLVTDTAHFDSFGVKRSRNFVTYIKERSNTPPGLYLYDMINKREMLVYESNSWDLEAKKVNTRYVEWKNKNGNLRGALITFPFDYDKNKKYPAIFSIYEKHKKGQNVYESPVDTIGSGLSYRHYNRNGYFVIKPDIHYEIGNPGISADVCVNQALDYLLDQYPIDPDRLGIIGHSFGGYQTNFIITQTHRFKTAVSSSGVADFVNRYFSFSKEYQKPNMWRFETQQYRMGKGFFDMSDKYFKNSPIYHAQNIHTPLLLLSGKEDYVVNSDESRAMFLALKRLKKEVNLLLYPNEGHVLMSPEHRKDASEKIISWFDYYLKDKSKPAWL